MQYSGKITIKETSAEDLENIMSLWNNGDVMRYVGFPEGLGITMDKLKRWLNWAIAKPGRCHYSIYADGIGYCGETFYDVDAEHKTAALDIKLLPEAHGKGIAAYALSYVMDRALKDGGADRAYVDPHPDNVKAWLLYEKLGFISRPRPDYLEEWETYLEITKEEWLEKCSQKQAQ
jgi:RimJ/RimL family protein N-acetyltransferase